MRYLLDANVVVWLLETPERIAPPAMNALLNPSNELIVSTASLLELTSKASAGRLDFDAEAYGKLDQIELHAEAFELDADVAPETPFVARTRVEE